jgi:hypothetical protein
MVALRVDGPFSCDGSAGHPTSAVPVTIFNIGVDPVDFGPGSLGIITSTGPDYLDHYLYGHKMDYATSAYGPTGFYYYDSGSSNIDQTELLPGRSASGWLAYKGACDTVLSDLRFMTRTNRELVLHVKLR